MTCCRNIVTDLFLKDLELFHNFLKNARKIVLLTLFLKISFIVFLLPVFGVRVSVTFHLTCVHNIFSLVWVAEWPPFGK